MSDLQAPDLFSHWLSSPTRQYLIITLVSGEPYLLAASRSFRNQTHFQRGHHFLEQRYTQDTLNEFKRCFNQQRSNHLKNNAIELTIIPVTGFLLVEELQSPEHHAPYVSDVLLSLDSPAVQSANKTRLEVLIGVNSKGLIHNLSGDVSALFHDNLETLIGTHIEALFHHLDIARYRNLVHQTKISGHTASGELRIKNFDAGVSAFHWTIISQGKDIVLVGHCNERNLEIELVKSEERLNLILETIEDAFLAVDMAWNLSYVNAKGASLLGKAPSSLLGKSIWDCAPWLKNSDAFPQFNEALSSQKPAIFTTQLTQTQQWFQVKACPNTEGISIFFTDITSIKLSEEKMRHQAMHDALTNLPNRLSLSYTLQDMIKQAEGTGHKIGLLFIDLDDFKIVNDTLGHDSGDELLIQVSKRLRDTVRQADIVARLSGDEFIIALHKVVSIDIAFAIGQKIVECVSRTPIQLGSEMFFVGASVGVAIFPDDGCDVESLMKCADMAMYDAKKAGKNAVRVYQSNMSLQLSNRLSIENALREAIGQNQLLVYYQPRFNRHGAIVGAEALARIQCADGQMMMPSDFIPVAEETGLIIPLGDFILNKACHDIARWNQQYGLALNVSVNVSGLQLLSKQFQNTVAQALKASGLPNHQLELELTETVLTQSEPVAIEQLVHLRQQGIHISVDDFGTGYSSLSILQHLPVTILKIDASFTKLVPEDTHAHDLVNGIIAMAHALHLQTVAEGIERTSQRDALIALNVDELQGYLFSKPVSAEQLQEQLAASVALH